MRNDAALLTGIMGLLCVFIVVAIVIAVFYFLTLQKALNRVAPHNRLMEPAMVWLGLIPLFNIVWNFFIVTRVPDSLRNEFREQGRDDGGDYGRGIGVAYATLVAISIPLNLLSNLINSPAVALIVGLLGLVYLVLFIMFWVKIAGYSGQLAAPPRRGRGDRDYDDDEDPDDDYPDRNPKGTPPDSIKPDERGRYR